MGIDTVILAEILKKEVQVVIVHHTGGGLYSEHWVHVRPSRKDTYELIQLRPDEAEHLGKVLIDGAERCRKLDALTQPMRVLGSRDPGVSGKGPDAP